MKRTILFLLLFWVTGTVLAQKKDPYVTGMKVFRQNYMANHEVVEKKDKKYFRFFPVNQTYRVIAHFDRIVDTVGFTMTTSANTLKHYYKYGRLDFLIDGSEYILYVYQGKDLMLDERYKDYLFVPFTDGTTGDESYGSGRYLEFFKQDILNNTVELDFNKAYNPYCAYSTGYKCPVPPKENRLPVAIRAGEKNFRKTH